MKKKIPVAVLGATGLVGQKFIELLQNHPMFEIAELVASEKSVGKRFAEACNQIVIPHIMPEIENIIVKPTNPNEVNSKLVFSALPADIALNVENDFARAGKIVISKASAFRMVKDVPLLIPEVNSEHLELLKIQKNQRDLEGCIITDPNCTTAGLALVLKPILDNFGIKQVNVTTMQALSGAGFPGVPSLSISDNIIPFIDGEEEKVERETLKILGKLNGNKIDNAHFKIFATCTRVPVIDGHTEVVNIITERDASIEDLKKALTEFKGLPQELRLPSAPEKPIIVREELDRPQPKLDRDSGRGMSVTVGRIKKLGECNFSLVLLVHNLVRGAAGAGVLDAELLAKTNLVEVS